MIVAMSASYPSQESVGVWFTVVLLVVLALGAIVAWMAGRPVKVAPVRFDVPPERCPDCGQKLPDECTCPGFARGGGRRG